MVRGGARGLGLLGGRAGNANIDIWLMNPSGQCLLILSKNIFPTKLFKGFHPLMI